MVLVLLAGIPCEPYEGSIVCHCKAGMVSACVALRESNPELAKKVDAAIQAAKVLEEAGRKTEEAFDAEALASSASPEPPECKGQEHHVISRPIAKRLESHETLSGRYKPRDPRFVARAVDEKAHCGYQEWHRKVDDEVIAWLRRYPKATVEQFESYLREIYSRPDMLKRFPHGF
ncbi:Wall-associated protein precursor [Archangium violaceum]|uniref:Wall-associated protein precursor n=1 Tax=Archangium violaceum TaxID=83451 RepID=UPI00193C2277|nr:Wall-associated protein precursor [Archangium violaceum]QRK11983.1 Wall-associated protein precursor [Archangium violaceum]